MPHIVSIVFLAHPSRLQWMWALGRLLFSRLQIRLHALEHDLLAFVAGGALLSFLVFMLCAAHAARTSIFLATGIVILALNWRFGARSAGSLPKLPRLSGSHCSPSCSSCQRSSIFQEQPRRPEIPAPTGQAYHLGLVYRFFREDGFHRLTTNMYSSFPLGIEMLFLFAFFFRTSFCRRDGTLLLPAGVAASSS